MYKLCFYVPETHVELVKDALFAEGAGRIGYYEACSWQVKGEGQFRPISVSTPFLGQKDQLEKVTEYKVEMVCEDQMIEEVVKTLKTVHPYEEPAYQVILLETF